MWAKSIISGEAKGTAEDLARLLLRVASACFYGPLVRIRNRLYDRGRLKSTRLRVPVICVGNITTGGTGKTPMVIWLCRYLQSQGRKVAILSRGYKSRGETGNDEMEIIRQAIPDVPIVMEGDRVRGGRWAIERYQPDVIVLDDGFQHRRLERDLDIVMIDCSCPFGYEHILPRGLLREPVEQLKRAGAVVLSHCDSITTDDLASLENRVRHLLEDDQKKPITQSRHEPIGLFAADGSEVELASLSGKKVAAFCGIGNPDSFVATLRQLAAEVTGQRFFDDHVRYDESIGEVLRDLQRECNADWLVTTEKDWVKLNRLPGVRAMKQLHWLKVEMVITQGQKQLCEMLDEIWKKARGTRH